MSTNYCLFFTATIDPGNSVPSLKRVDHNLRESDYIEAISKWIKFKIPIIFCENSNTRSEKIIKILSESGVPFEYLSFQSIKSHLGKGHGEFEIFEYAFQNSKILNDSIHIVKVTGRYTIKNFISLLNDCVEKDSFIYVNIRYGYQWGDSRFFSFKKNFWYQYLSKYALSIDEKNMILFEHILAKATLSAILDNQKWVPLKSLPQVEGVYGTDNKVYKNFLIGYHIKNLMHKLKIWLIFKLPY